MLYPVIGLPPFETGGDQVSCTPLPLAGPAVKFCGADGTLIPVCVGVLVGVGVGVMVGPTGVLVGVGVCVGVDVGVGVLVGVGVGPTRTRVANLKLQIRVVQLNCETPVG